MASWGVAEWLEGLVVDGIISGVGAVLGFVPQMVVFFIFLAFLEACGYMARIAFILDRAFRKFGLSGKSFIPMLIGSGCGVPAIMASRTIENAPDRRMTIMTTTMIPCSAKMPIIALVAGAYFGGEWWVAPSAYFVGIAAIIISGIILKRPSCLPEIPRLSSWNCQLTTCRPFPTLPAVFGNELPVSLRRPARSSSFPPSSYGSFPDSAMLMVRLPWSKT